MYSNVQCSAITVFYYKNILQLMNECSHEHETVEGIGVKIRSQGSSPPQFFRGKGTGVRLPLSHPRLRQWLKIANENLTEKRKYGQN